MKYIISLMSAVIMVFSTSIFAETITPKIIQIESLSQISDTQPPKTLFFFDLDDTVFDSFSMLGSKAWRRYIVESANDIDSSENWHDIFSYALAQKHPLITVEDITSTYIQDLQNKKFVVCGLTSRERKLWYDMPHVDIDVLTVQQLASLGVNFYNGSLEEYYPALAMDSEYFGGVFFVNIEPKGNYLLHLFEGSTDLPEKVVFVDDKLSQVQSVANALAQLGIPHEAYYYPVTDKKGNSFNPLIANIQLYYFYESDGVIALSDAEAELIAKENPEYDAGHYLELTLNNITNKKKS